MDKKAKKRAEVLRKKVAQLQTQLAGAKQQPDDPGEPARRPFELSLELWRKGVYVRCGGDTLQFAPPFISEPPEIETLFRLVAEVLEESAAS